MQRRQNRAAWWRQQPFCAAWLVALLLLQVLGGPAFAQGQSVSAPAEGSQEPTPKPPPPPAGPSLSQECSDRLLAPLNEPNSPAGNNQLRRIDASGRVPAALAYYGTFVSFGSYEECLHTDKSQYCTATAVLLPDVVADPNLSYLGWLGLCLPERKHCNESDVKAVYNMVGAYGSLGLETVSAALNQSAVPIFLTVNTTIQCTDGSTEHFSLGAALVLGLCAIVVLTTVAATIMDLFEDFLDQRGDGRTYHSPQYGTPKGGLDMLMDVPLLPPVSPSASKTKKKKSFNPLRAFSLSRSIPQLCSLKSSPNVIESLDGIRVLSMTWVILGHTYLWLEITLATANIVDKPILYERLAAQPIINGFLSVDSFFFLSGFLVALFFQRASDKPKYSGGMSYSKPPNPFYVFALRLLRLLPLYMMVLLVYWQLLQWMILPGPLSIAIKSPDHNCDKNWWTNLLFINNFIPHDGDLSHECLGWSWYLAVDMQLFIAALAPLMLLGFKSKSANFTGIGLICTTIVSSIVVPFALTYAFDLPANTYNSVGEDVSLYNKQIYIKPYSRAAPYFIGVLTGYFFAKKMVNEPPRQLDNVPFIGKFLLGAVMWICTGAMMIFCVYGFYTNNHYPDHRPWSKLARAAYNGFARPAWGLGLSWIVIACEWKWAGPIGTILSAPIWKPLSKLTYGAYLVHPIVLDIYFYSQRTAFYMNDITMICIFVSTVFFSFGIAAVLYVTLERPAAVLTRPPKKEE